MPIEVMAALRPVSKRVEKGANGLKDPYRTGARSFWMGIILRSMDHISWPGCIVGTVFFIRCIYIYSESFTTEIIDQILPNVCYSLFFLKINLAQSNSMHLPSLPPLIIASQIWGESMTSP